MGSISFPADKWNSVLQGTIPVVFFAYIFSQEILCYLVKFHFKVFDAIRQTPKYGTYSSVWNLNLHAEFTFSLKHFLIFLDYFDFQIIKVHMFNKIVLVKSGFVVVFKVLDIFV